MEGPNWEGVHRCILGKNGQRATQRKTSPRKTRPFPHRLVGTSRWSPPPALFKLPSSAMETNGDCHNATPPAGFSPGSTQSG